MKIIKGCLFCGIAGKEITENVFKLYEDKLLFALLSNNPVNRGHAIVLTREHICNPSSLSQEVAGKMFHLATRIGIAAKRGLNADGYDIFTAEGYCAGQGIEHVHLHVIPRYLGDGHSWNWKILTIQDEFRAISNNIISKLNHLDTLSP